MTQEMKEKIRDTLSIAYQIGFTHKSAGNMAYLEADAVLDALMDSIVLAEKGKVAVPKPDHVTEVPADGEDDIVWREHRTGEVGCIGCICRDCVHGICGTECEYGGVSQCADEHPDAVIRECKYFEME